jgi:AcrR family transcriptional regulator
MTAVAAPAPAGRTDRKRAQTRSRLVEAAAGVFADRGIEATTIADITEAADVGVGTFYNYFRTKEELTEVVSSQMADLLGEALQAASASREDARESLAAIIHEVFAWFAREPVWGRFLLAIGVHHRDVIDRAGGVLIEVVSRGRRQGVVSEQHAELAVVSIAGLVVAALGFLHEGLVPSSSRVGFVSHALRMIGVPVAEADALAARLQPA